MPVDTIVISDNLSDHVSPALLNDEALCQRAPLHSSSHQEQEDHVNSSCNASDNLALSASVSNGNSGGTLSLSIDEMHRMEVSSLPQAENNNTLQSDKKAPGILLMRHHHHHHVPTQLNFSPQSSDADVANHLGCSVSVTTSALGGSGTANVSTHSDTSPVLPSTETGLKTDDKSSSTLNHFTSHGQLSSSLDTSSSLISNASSGPVLTPSGAGQPPPQQPLHPFHQLTSTSALHSAAGGGMLTQSHAPTMSPSPSAPNAEGRVNPGNVSEFELARRLGVRFDSSNAAWVARWVDSQNDRKKSRWFSIAKYGNAAARRLAIQACLHNMKPSDFLNLRDLQEVLKTFNTNPPVGAQGAVGGDLSHLTDNMGSFGAAAFPGMMRTSGLIDVHAVQAMGLFGASPGSKLAQYGHPHLFHHAHQQQAVAAAVAANPFGLPGFPNSAMAGYMAAAAAAAAMPPGMATHPAAAAAALAGVFCPQLTAQQQQLQNFAAALQHQHQLHQQCSNQIHPSIVQTNENHVMVNNGTELAVTEGMGMNTMQPKEKKEHTMDNVESESPLPFSAPENSWAAGGASGTPMVGQPCKFAIYEESRTGQTGVVQPSTTSIKADLGSTTKHELNSIQAEAQHIEGTHTHQLGGSDVQPSIIDSRLPEQQFLQPLPQGQVMPPSVTQDRTSPSPSRFVLSDNSLSANEEDNSTSSSSSTSSDLENRSDGSLSSDDEDQLKNDSAYAAHERKKRRLSRDENTNTETLVHSADHETATPVHTGENVADPQAVGAINPNGLSPFGFFNPAAAGVAGGIQNAAAMAAAAAAANHLQSSYYSFYSPAAFHQQQGGNSANMMSQTHASPQNNHPQSWMLHQQQHHAHGPEPTLQHASLPFLSPQFNLPMLHPHLQSSHHAAAAAAAAVASGGFFPQTHHSAFDLVNVHNGSYNQFLKGIGGAGGGGSSGSAAASSGASPRPTPPENEAASFGQGLLGSPSQQMMSYGKRGSISSIHHGLSDSEGGGTSSVNGTQTAKMTCERGLHYSKNYEGSQECWIAVWNTKGGRIMHEAFDVATLGYETAKNKAREARDAAHSNNVAVIENSRPSWKSHSNTGIPHVSLDSQQLRFRAHKFGRRLCRSFSFGRRRGSYTSRESAFDAAVLWLIQSPTEEEIAAVSGMSAKIEEAL